MKPVIEIIVVGNEILSGRIIDKNAPYMIESLLDAGFTVRFISVVGDSISEIAGVLNISTGRAHIVLVTGGLGPTSDDVTVEAAAQSFDRALVPDETVLEWIKERFRRRKRIMSDSNRKQALIPEGAEPFENPIGTAPGICMRVKNSDSSSDSEATVFLMPGVPREMQTIFDTVVLPLVSASFEPSSFETTSLQISGISESQLYDTIRHLPGAKAFAFYPGYSGIKIVIQTDDQSPVKASILKEKVIEIMGDRVFSTSGESLEEVLAKKLMEKQITIGIAESCTGGLISHKLTNIPGSSAYMLCGMVAYSNESKRDILGVDSRLIEMYGAVSAEVATAMAEGVRKIAGSDIGVSTTGIAGPGGGSAEKSVGLMYTSISSEFGTQTKKLQFGEDRLINKNRMSHVVLDNLRLYLKNCK